MPEALRPDLESPASHTISWRSTLSSPLLAIRRSGGALIAAFLLGATAASSVAAEPTERGRDLAATCTGCHNTNGKAIGEGKPIAGMAAERIVTLLAQFRDGTRQATVMHQIAKGYTPEQIRLIADYLAAQK
jgi:cytochrome c553